MPDAPVVVSEPLKVDRLETLIISMEEAAIDCEVKSVALTIVSAFKGTVPPADRLNTMEPTPAVKLRFCAPLSVFENKISPVALDVLNATAPPKLTGPLNAMRLLTLVMLSESKTPPAPACVNGPLRVI